MEQIDITKMSKTEIGEKIMSTPKPVDVTKKTLDELKIMAFDVRELIDLYTNNLNVLRNEMALRNKPPNLKP